MSESTKKGSSSRRHDASTEEGVDPATATEHTDPDEDTRPSGQSEEATPRTTEGSEIEEDEAERLRTELSELNDRHLRLAAEFDNFRRRSQSQMGQSGLRAQASLVEKLLDVLDDFERMSELDPDQASVDSVLEGMELVERKLHRVLTDAGLEPIDPEGEPFDPNSMEAMLKEPTDEPEEDDTVGQVLQRGFRFRGQLVRPARVSVRQHHDG
jgi:molecular chaperone GrpE